MKLLVLALLCVFLIGCAPVPECRPVLVGPTTIYYVHGYGVVDRYDATGKMIAHSQEHGIMGWLNDRLMAAVGVITLVWGTH
jgi:hypothetical protein